MENKFIESTIQNLLAAHIGLTIFQNTPDTLVPSLNHFMPGWSLPQWRFFAPTPGTTNHHIFYRSRKNTEDNFNEWQELCPENKSTWITTMWNPNSRYVKANFDLASSIINLVSYGATFDFIKVSDTYLLISELIKERTKKINHLEYQFMISISIAQDDGDYSFEPKLFSEIIEVGD